MIQYNMRNYLTENDHKKLLALAVAAAQLDERSQVLNIACEFERVPDFLPARVRPESVFGLEIDRQLVAKDSNIKYCDVDRDLSPFPDNAFDVALSIFGVEHFKTGLVFKETCRTLKPGGRFIFVAPNGLYPAFLINRIFGERFAAFYYKSVVKSPYKPHAAYYRFNSAGAIERVAKDAGFSQCHLTFFGPANIMLYAGRNGFAKKMINAFERLISNRMLYRFKPYILATLVK